MKRVLILGGYGTFGAIAARELADAGVELTIAGRDSAKAVAFAAQLGDSRRGMALDLNDAAAVRKALHDSPVVVNCAGPFSSLKPAILDACIEQHCDYVDIGDDRGYVAAMRSRHESFSAAGVTGLYGCSSLPAISGALALRLMHESTVRPRAALVSLLVGNNNPKGIAAITSLLRTLGQPIRAPQGTLRGFRDRLPVTFPPPFGSRRNYTAESPEYDVFPDLLGVSSVRVGFCFELAISNWLMSTLARLPFRYGRQTGRFLAAISAPFRRLGCSGGAVMTHLTFDDGSSRSGTVLAREGGQRMAAMPAVLAVEALLRGASRPGSGTAYDLLGADRLLDEMKQRGFEVHWH